MLTRLVRMGLCVAAATVAFVGFGSAANAQGSHRVPVGGAPYDVPAADCGFPVHVGIVDNKEYYIHTSTLADGSTYFQITGKLKLSATNTLTGKTIQVNASGSSKEIVHPDGTFSITGGGHLFSDVTPADQAQFGLPGLILATGHGFATGVLSATGFDLTTFSFDGNITDVCAELA